MHLISKEKIDQLTIAWQNEESKVNGCTIVRKPFKVFSIQDLFSHQDLTPVEFCQTLIDDEILNPKLSDMLFAIDARNGSNLDNDLYSLRQSVDLSNIDIKHFPLLTKLRDTIRDCVRPMLEKITNQSLDGHVSMTVSEYKRGNYLLCHDDRMPQRRIAYIYYLTPNWKVLYGGTLDLFNANEYGLPTTVAVSLTPQCNQFNFFQVGHNTYHQVSEVLIDDVGRYSVHGWFHTKDDRCSLPPSIRKADDWTNDIIDIDESTFYSWISNKYIEPVNQAQIRQQFSDDSQIILNDFIRPEKYASLLEQLREIEISSLDNAGPANLRNYYTLPRSTPIDDTTPMHTCARLLNSDAILLLISQLTGLKLHALYEDSDEDTGDDKHASSSAKRARTTEPDIQVQSEIRIFMPGSYTLLVDNESKVDENMILDVYFFTTEHNWDTDDGGYTCYVNKTEPNDDLSQQNGDDNESDDDELLTVVPQSNALALIYREATTDKFVKYVRRCDQVTSKRTKKIFADIHVQVKVPD